VSVRLHHGITVPQVDDSLPLPYKVAVGICKEAYSRRLHWCFEDVGQRYITWDISIDNQAGVTTFSFADEKVAFEFLLRFA
jgi:hypothetical protein